MSKKQQSNDSQPQEIVSEHTETTHSTEAAPAAERRKTPLEMVRERQAAMRGVKSGAGRAATKSEMATQQGASKPPQITRKAG